MINTSPFFQAGIAQASVPADAKRELEVLTLLA